MVPSGIPGYGMKKVMVHNGIPGYKLMVADIVSKMDRFPSQLPSLRIGVGMQLTILLVCCLSSDDKADSD